MFDSLHFLSLLINYNEEAKHFAVVTHVLDCLE